MTRPTWAPGGFGQVEEQWYSAADVADKLGVAQKTVRKWIRNGELDAWLVGGRVGYRIRESELERFTNSRGRRQRAAVIAGELVADGKEPPIADS